MGIGPYQSGEKVRIPLEVLLNGKAIPVSNARIQRIILPNKTNAAGFPRSMIKLKDGTYIFETTEFSTIGNYTAIIQAEVGGDTIEQIEPFIIQKPFGFPSIRVATDEEDC